MVKDIVIILVKDMVMSKSISSTIIRSNCLSLSPGVPRDSVGDIGDSLGTGFRDTGDSEVAVGDIRNALRTNLRNTGNSAGDTCRYKTGTPGC